MHTLRTGMMSIVTLLIMVWITALTPAGGVHAARSSSPTGSSFISGRVTAADTSTGLAGISVTVYNSAGFSTGFATTDATGSYATFASLDAGNYRVKFSPSFATGDAANYLGEFYNDKPTLATADLVTVDGTTPALNINVSLARGGAVSGRITNSGGNGVDQINVELTDACGTAVKGATSTSDGTYTIGGLLSGTYYLRTASTTTYAAASYRLPGSPNSADPITVVVPNTTPNINVALVNAGQISGRVVDDNGTPI